MGIENSLSRLWKNITKVIPLSDRVITSKQGDMLIIGMYMSTMDTDTSVENGRPYL